MLTVPAELSMTSLRICWPAGSVTLTLTVVNVCQPPVAGQVLVPESFAPVEFSIWIVPPAPPEATLAPSVYVPAVATLIVYFIHSPLLVQPTLKPPPVSVHASTSTPSVRYAPPLL